MMPDTPQESLSAVLQPAPATRFAAVQPALVASLIAVLLAGGFGIYQYASTRELKSEVRRTLAASEKARQDLLAAQSSITTHQQQLDARLALIEARQTEALQQQDTLGRMYDTLTRSDTVRALAEIEQTLTFASQQLQLTGNSAAAYATLVSVDQKLAQLNRPELINLRQALAKDTDALKSLPAFDLTGITVKLDNLAKALDNMPLVIDGFVEPAAPAPKVEGDRLTRFAAELWHEIKQLIQIRRMDKPDAQLLSPEQAFFIRQHIKLRLVDARTALLLRDETSYRADMTAVLTLLKQHFDVRAPLVSSHVAQVQQFATQAIALKLPDLGSSLAAARNARAVAERVKP